MLVNSSHFFRKYRLVYWGYGLNIGVHISYIRAAKIGKNQQKRQKKRHFGVQNAIFDLMVPPARIELAIDPYHGSVIPLN